MTKQFIKNVLKKYNVDYVTIISYPFDMGNRLFAAHCHAACKGWEESEDDYILENFEYIEWQGTANDVVDNLDKLFTYTVHYGYEPKYESTISLYELVARMIMDKIYPHSIDVWGHKNEKLAYGMRASDMTRDQLICWFNTIRFQPRSEDTRYKIKIYLAEVCERKDLWLFERTEEILNELERHIKRLFQWNNRKHWVSIRSVIYFM